MVGPNARVLVLGSFPSERSLETGEYYANRRNQFWSLLGAVFAFDAELPYRERLNAVTRHGVALWDVVHSCRRVGSMDREIDRKTLVVNDFAAFRADNPEIDRVFVNGLTAFALYEKHVAAAPPAIRLPSSSGAATMALADKLGRWRALQRPDRSP